jgi:hypothetical protein
MGFTLVTVKPEPSCSRYDIKVITVHGIAEDNIYNPLLYQGGAVA